DSVERVQSEGPKDLRDLVWLPAQIAFRSGSSVNALLPTRYPGADPAQDVGLRLARRTDWNEESWGTRGAGQHEWALGQEADAGLLSLRRLSFKVG
ncbi:MAG TPA: type VI secretion system accessory protein TagJ, partial [Caulobacteraceae bacterium]